MNILIYNWKDIENPLAGGSEIVTFEYAKRLVRDGNQVTWFCRFFPGASSRSYIEGITIIREGGILSTYWKGYRYYKSLQEKPDIVIDALNTIAWQTPLYAKKKSRIIQYVHQLAKEVWGYELHPPFSWIGKILEPLQLIPYHDQYVITHGISTVHELVSWGYNRTKILHFKPGIDHTTYIPGTKSVEPLLIQVCRMVSMKRPDLTVRAFAEIAQEFPTARLALVGTGPYIPRLRNLISILGMNKRVIFEKTDHIHKVELMQRAWCFIHPSVKEGWGMVITEAAACGTPSIATAVSGHVDSVKDNETGLLISPDPTVEELANAMRRMIVDNELRNRMSKNCVEWAAKFDWEKGYIQFRNAIGLGIY